MFRMRNFLAALALAVPAAAAPAADYPSRPIRIVVAYSPGGGVDVMTRSVAQKLAESLGQPVPVENRPGGNGMVGAQAVARAAPDGHMLVVLDRGALTINPSLYREMPYDPLRDFAYTGVSTELPYVLTVNAAVPVASLAEFAQLARSRPGAINYASFGSGSLIHLNFEQLAARLGIALTHVPYKGSARAATAVVTGEAGIFISSYAGVASFIRDGRLRALAVGRTTRLPALPEVPTAAELGLGEDVLAPGYFTFAAPAGTPRAVLMKLNAEIARALALPDITERLQAAGMEPHATTPEAFVEGVRRDIARFGKLVASLGIPRQ